MPNHAFSFEFFPPKTPEGMAKLQAVHAELAALKPDFCSVTFGAGGSTRDRTLETVLTLQASGIPAAPHLSCIGATRLTVREILQTYQQQGIRHLVALRGDLPSGTLALGDFSYAGELVAFIRAETGTWFHLEVAAYPEIHPQARDYQADLKNFARKVQAGADSALTQYFYNAEAYFRFVEAATAQGVGIPIVPGIMPIHNYTQLARFSEACGAEIPRWLRKKLESYGDDIASIRAYGLDVVTELCARLLAGGAPGLHFYTMNQSQTTLAIWQGLKLQGPSQHAHSPVLLRV